MPVGVQLSGFAESCSKLWSFRSVQLIDKFGSRASFYAATGADGPDSAVGPEVWAAHYFDDELWGIDPCTPEVDSLLCFQCC